MTVIWVAIGIGWAVALIAAVAHMWNQGARGLALMMLLCAVTMVAGFAQAWMRA